MNTLIGNKIKEIRKKERLKSRKVGKINCNG